MNTKNWFGVAVVGVTFAAVAGIGIYQGVLQSDLNAGGYSITNVVSLLDTNGNSITGSSFDSQSLTNVRFLPVDVAPDYAQGRMFYDTNTHSIAYYNDNAQMTVNLAQEQLVRVRNNSGITITNGKAVYVTGATGQTPTVALASALSISVGNVIGVATVDITNNTFGYITIDGIVNNVDTATFAEGANLFLSTNLPGELVTNQQLSASAVGIVLHSHANNGRILVRPSPVLDTNAFALKAAIDGIQSIVFTNQTGRLVLTGSTASATIAGVGISNGVVSGITRPVRGIYNTGITAGSTNYMAFQGQVTTINGTPTWVTANFVNRTTTLTNLAMFWNSAPNNAQFFRVTIFTNSIANIGTGVATDLSVLITNSSSVVYAINPSNSVVVPSNCWYSAQIITSGGAASGRPSLYVEEMQ